MKSGNLSINVDLEPWTLARLDRVVAARRDRVAAVDSAAKVSRRSVLREILEREISKAEVAPR